MPGCRVSDIVLPRVFRDGAPHPPEANKFVLGYPAHAYHADREAISQGFLQTINRTPAHFLYEWAQPYRDNFASDPTIVRIGRITGEMLFEPEVYKRYILEQSFGDQRKKENKAAKQDWLASLPRDYVAADDEGKLSLLPTAPVITEYEQATANAMAAAVRAYPELEPIWNELKFEVTVVWVDPETGILCRARLDIVHENSGTIWDMKTTECADEAEFGRVAFTKGYHFQGSQYLAAGNAVMPGHFKRYKFIVAERPSPYEACDYELGERELALGEQERRRALRRLRQCIDSGVWPGYPAKRTLSFPPWAFNNMQLPEGGF